MQAIFLITVFGILMGIMASMLSLSTDSTSKQKIDHIAETKTYFNNLAKVINEQIVPTYLEANPNNYTTVSDYVQGMTDLKILTIAKTAGGFVDGWDHPVIARWVDGQWLSLLDDNGNNKVEVPNTGFLLVSKGPDNVLQTVVPASLANVNEIYNVVPAGDDIVFAFDVRGAQRKVLQDLTAHLKHIAAASVNELQPRLQARQKALLDKYQAIVAAGGTPSIDMLNLANDTGAGSQTFLPLDTAANIKANAHTLGVDGDFDYLQRPLPNGGRFTVLSSTPDVGLKPMLIQLTNSATPTPWGHGPTTFKLTIVADISNSVVK